MRQQRELTIMLQPGQRPSGLHAMPPSTGNTTATREDRVTRHRPSAPRRGVFCALRQHRLTLAVACAAATGSAASVTHWLQGEGPAVSGLVLAHSLLGLPPPVVAPSPAETLPHRTLIDEQAIFLVRSTLMALNDANRSGNYSVLRDLAGPRFQARNSVLRLREAFQALRDAGVDLSHVGMVEPRIAQRLASADGAQLTLQGDVAAAPGSGGKSIGFALEFEAVGGHWRLLTLSVNLAAKS